MEVALGAAPAVLVGLAFTERIRSGRGTGTKFIRVVTMCFVVPIAAILALRGVITGDMVAGLLGAALGYAFGQVESRRN